jgi:hypothetical protein
VNISWPEGDGGGGGGANWIPRNPFTASPSSAIPAFKEHAHDSLSTFLKQWHRKDPLALASALPASSSRPPPSAPTPRAPSAPSAATRSRSTSPLASFDTRLRPVVQMGPFDLTAETDLVVPGIFRTANAFATAPGGNRTVLDWTSGYFGLREDYKRLALQCKAKVRIVSASPEVRSLLSGSRAGRLSGDTDPRRAGQRVLRLSRRLSLHPAGLYPLHRAVLQRDRAGGGTQESEVGRERGRHGDRAERVAERGVDLPRERCVASLPR